jgi:hypothetical protein
MGSTVWVAGWKLAWMGVCIGTTSFLPLVAGQIV